MDLSFWSLNRGNRGLLKILNLVSSPTGSDDKTKMTHLLVEFVSSMSISYLYFFCTPSNIRAVKETIPIHAVQLFIDFLLSGLDG